MSMEGSVPQMVYIEGSVQQVSRQASGASWPATTPPMQVLRLASGPSPSQTPRVVAVQVAPTNPASGPRGIIRNTGQAPTWDVVPISASQVRSPRIVPPPSIAPPQEPAPSRDVVSLSARQVRSPRDVPPPSAAPPQEPAHGCPEQEHLLALLALQAEAARQVLTLNKKIVALNTRSFAVSPRADAMDPSDAVSPRADVMAPSHVVNPGADAMAPGGVVSPGMDAMAPNSAVSTGADAMAPSDSVSPRADAVAPGSVVSPGADAMAPSGSVGSRADSVAPGGTVSPGADAMAPSDLVSLKEDTVAPGGTVSPGADAMAPSDLVSPKEDTVAPGSAVSPGADPMAPSNSVSPKAEVVVPSGAVIPGADAMAPSGAPEAEGIGSGVCGHAQPLLAAEVAVGRRPSVTFEVGARPGEEPEEAYRPLASESDGCDLRQPLLGATSVSGRHADRERRGSCYSEGTESVESLACTESWQLAKFRQTAVSVEKNFMRSTSKDGPISHARAQTNGQGEDEENDVYKDRGFCSEVARSPLFQSFTTFIIVFSSLWIGVETDYNTAEILCDAPLVFQLVDNFVCVFFTFELVVRFIALKRKSIAFKSSAFLLDIFLVVVMVWETWVQVTLYLLFQNRMHMGGFMKSTPALRVLRLLRIIRSARLWKLFPDLFTFMEGMVKGVKAVTTTLVLLIGVIYMFAIAFTQLLGATEDGKGSFETVLMSMHFLFLTSLCSIDKNFITKMLSAGWIYWMLWLLFLLIANLTIMRMLTGIILNLVNDVHHKNKDNAQKYMLQQEVSDILALYAESYSNSIPKQNFMPLVQNEHIMEKLVALGVDVNSFVETTLKDWEKDEVLSVNDLVKIILQYRGSNPATLRHLMRMRRELEAKMAQHSTRMQDRLGMMLGKVAEPTARLRRSPP